MYIQKAEIKNIRSIENFEIEFKNPAGWHVLIGDNGAGKSTIIRSIALVLVSNVEISGLRANWADWLNKPSFQGKINLDLLNFTKGEGEKLNQFITATFIREKTEKSSEVILTWNVSTQISNENNKELKIRFQPIFSAAYGPYRRFEGGNEEWEKLFKNPSYSNLTAHLSAFGEDVALTEPISWLKDLNYKLLETKVHYFGDKPSPIGKTKSEYTLENLKKLINSEDFLPHNTKLESVSSEGVFFKDGNGVTISVNQMSDGYRSILSLTFELIRQLDRVYGAEKVFKNIEKGEMFIDLPGVVLVDEIDAHLHPTWQTRIGQWFLKYFPKLQFIVTTHSPLVCRAAENGSIWRLAAPGSDEKSGEVTGIDRDRLIYGNVLDAYGTEVFGTNVTISEESVKKQETLVKLSKKQMLDDISPEEEEKLQDLKKIFTTDAPIEL